MPANGRWDLIRRLKVKNGCSAVVIITTVYCKQRMACSNDGPIPVIIKRLKETVSRSVSSIGQTYKPRVYNQVYTRRSIVIKQLF